MVYVEGKGLNYLIDLYIYINKYILHMQLMCIKIILKYTKL